MKYLFVLALLPVVVQAAPWNSDCVTFWGKAIPVEERNSENCPNGTSHWDKPQTASNSQTREYGSAIDVPGYQTTNTNSSVNPYMPTTVVTNTGTYLVIPRYSGGNIPMAVIRSGK